MILELIIVMRDAYMTFNMNLLTKFGCSTIIVGRTIGNAFQKHFLLILL